MTLRDCLRSGTDYLRRCGVPEARLDAELLLAHVLGEERLRLRIEVRDSILAGFLEHCGRIDIHRHRCPWLNHPCAASGC